MKKLGISFVIFGLSTLSLITSLGLTSAVESAPIADTGTVVDIAAGPTTAVVAFGGMAPGDEVTRSFKISNNGRAGLRYSVRSTTTETRLAAQLALIIRGPASLPAGCDNAGFEEFGPTVLYLNGPLGSPEGVNIIGDAMLGPDTGDRTLVAGTEEYLCFQVGLPLSTGNTYQGLNTTATFHFIAE